MVCARHGCFIPNALADLFRGEQQKNLDYILLKVIEMTSLDPEQGLLIIYDIICQYFVYLLLRIGKWLPEGLDIERAIDLFHVHAHKDQCFFRYATTFVPGAGAVAGQILESLWSNLNAISPMARTATLAHRAEILDDHTTDSNYKVMMAMPNTLCNKWRNALKVSLRVDKAYLDFSSTISEAKQAEWEAQIRAAEARRSTDISAMDIYGADVVTFQNAPTAPSETQAGEGSPVEVWIQYALDVEEKQLEIQDKVRRLARVQGGQQSDDIELARNTLHSMMATLKEKQVAAGAISAELTEEQQKLHEAALVTDEVEFDEVVQDAIPSTVINDHMITIERQTLILPSNHNVKGNFSPTELALRQRQARREISNIRDIVADLSFQFSAVLRKSPRQSARGAAQKRVKHMQHELTHHARIYTICRRRLQELGCPEDFLRHFKELRRSDLKASTEILQPNMPGSTNIQLPWIWHTGRFFTMQDQAWADDMAASTDTATLLECEFNEVCEYSANFGVAVKRVHWLRARAQMQRWHEEVLLLSHEMQWTVRFYMYKARTWEDSMSVGGVTPGAKAYALRQIDMWRKLAVGADALFSDLTSQYESPM
ncbi:hypothetical protein CVT26_011993 [Gymnopilus dilepis]|uniref:Uncharacterized protein n=1 Tax=Gymnopilus dilepis TaxID=231916 RepID=A0A409X6Q6_9AGAR|nr:hypothetical protein CVT26_011993 [Gymnopilus dilepis]